MKLATRTRVGLAAALVISSVSFGACKKDNKTGSGGGPLAAIGGAGGGASDPLAYLPANSEVVLQLDLARVRSSELFKQYVEPKMKKEIEGDDDYAKLKTNCGFDPWEQAGQVHMGMSDVTDDGPGTVVVVVTGFDKTKVLACLEKSKEEIAKEGSSITVDGNIIIVEPKNEKTNFGGAFVTDTMFVGVAKPKAKITVDEVKAKTTGKDGLASSKEFAAMHGQIKPGALKMFVNGNAAFMKKSEAMTGKVEAVFGSIDAEKLLAANFVARMGSEDEAKKVAELGKSQGGMAASMVTKFDVSANGKDVAVVVEISPEQIKQLVGMFGGGLGL